MGLIAVKTTHHRFFKLCRLHWIAGCDQTFRKFAKFLPGKSFLSLTLSWFCSTRFFGRDRLHIHAEL